MARVTATGAAIALAALLVAACGGASTKTEVFRPKNPLLSDLYLQVRAPSGALPVLARRLRKTKTLGGFSVAVKAHGREDCRFTRALGPDTGASLQKYVGQKVTVRIYGNNDLAPSFCKGFGKALGGGSGAAAAARSQQPRGYGCTYLQRMGNSSTTATVYFTIRVSPRRFGPAWCSEFQHHFHPPLVSGGFGTEKRGTGHRFCALARRAVGAHAALDVYASRRFAGIVTCKMFRSFPPPGFRRTG
jgi:hypothetical protein